ncbi:MAG: NAD(P)-binding protein [Candidatus Coatesbacteria bacterium]|nr:NAD(P)-binding protein [Candidatus Coatesbacteria bacterium]
MKLVERKISPCRLACPIGTNVQGYIGLISIGKYKEALEIARENNPFPATCGRLCSRPCEAECRRAKYDEPLMIADLKRFISDIILEEEIGDNSTPIIYDEKIAIVGAGPAGLTAAWILRKAGFNVTLLDQHEKAGGTLMYLLPSFLLPKNVLEKEINRILSYGIEFKGNLQLGSNISIDELRKDGYASIILALGSAHDFSFPSKWQLMEDVYWGPYFFLEKIMKEPEKLSGMRVLFIGTGSLTLTLARIALRGRAREVQLWSSFDKEKLSFRERDLEEAQHEGLLVKYGMNLGNIEHSAGGAKVFYRKAISFESDDNNRDIGKWSKEILTDLFDFVIDTRFIGPAGRQARLLNLPTYGIMLFPKADPATLKSPINDIYMAGDFVSGPKTIIEAIASGHKVARTVISDLQKQQPKSTTYSPTWELPINNPKTAYRPHLESLVIDCEQNPEGETIAPLTESQAVHEARRCLRCGPCSECPVCFDDCHYKIFIDINDKKKVRTIPEFVNHTVTMLIPAIPIVSKELCNGCGLCIEKCSYNAIYLLDKKLAVIKERQCKGCGICIEVCPEKALMFQGD